MLPDITLPFPQVGKDDKESIQNLYDTVMKLRKELEFILYNLDTKNVLSSKRADVATLYAGTIEANKITTVNASITNAQIDSIEANKITTVNAKITTGQIETLTVGSNVTMGSSATISWTKVTDQPSLTAAADSIANGTYSGGTFISGKVISSPSIVTNNSGITANDASGIVYGASGYSAASTDIRIWAGESYANRATAPFKVTHAGAVTASNLTITGGNITWANVAPPTASQVGALPDNTFIPTVPAYITSTKITSTTIESPTITGAAITTNNSGVTANDASGIVYGASGYSAASTDIRIWAGESYANRASAPFKVNQAGAVTASNLTITGGNITWTNVDPPTASQVGARASDWIPSKSSLGNWTTWIGSDGIYTGTLTATQVNAVAISADSITAGTLTGRTIKTAASGANRIEMTSSGITSYDSSNRKNGLYINKDYGDLSLWYQNSEILKMVVSADNLDFFCLSYSNMVFSHLLTTFSSNTTVDFSYATVTGFSVKFG